MMNDTFIIGMYSIIIKVCKFKFYLYLPLYSFPLLGTPLCHSQNRLLRIFCYSDVFPHIRIPPLAFKSFFSFVVLRKIKIKCSFRTTKIFKKNTIFNFFTLLPFNSRKRNTILLY